MTKLWDFYINLIEKLLTSACGFFSRFACRQAGARLQADPADKLIKFTFGTIVRRKVLLLSSLILVVGLFTAYNSLFHRRAAFAAWFDDNWAYRKAISIPSHTTAEANVYVTVPSFDATDTSRFQADCGDLRFTKQNGETLPYYVVACNATATIHVQFDSLPAGASTYFMYYGNPSVGNGFESADFSTAATGLGSQALAAEEKTVGPVAYWKLDEGYGTTANNSTSVIGINPVSQDVGTNIAETNYYIKFANYNTWVKIHNSISSSPAETVTDYPGDGGTHTRGVDYEMDYANGMMRILSTGNMAINTGYYIDDTFTNAGAAWQSEDQCISGKCIYFDGVDDSLKVTSNINLSVNSSSRITMQAWVKPLNNTNPDGSNIGGIISHNYGNPRIYYNYNSANTFTFYHQFVDQYRALTTPANYPVGKWYFAVGTWDGTYMKIYINGVLAVTSPDYSAYTVSSRQDSYYMGRCQYGVSKCLLKGFLDEAKVYSYARSADQVKSDYAAGLSHQSSVKGTSVALGNPNKNAEALSDGLVGYWKMDEASWNGSSNEVVDSSGNGNHGLAACSGASCTVPTTGTGKFGNGGSFDGSEDYANVSSSTWETLPTNNSVTVSLWVKRSSLSQNAGLFVSSYGNHVQGRWGVLMSSSGTPFASLYAKNASTYRTATATTATSTTQWYLITAVFDRTTQQIKIYVNGAQEGSGTFLNTDTLESTDSQPDAIGSQMGTANKYFFNGLLDDVRIYNRALSPAEVSFLYNWTPGPVGHWNMNEKSGTSVNDISGNGNVGTLGGISGSIPSWITGKYGGGLNFTARNWVNIPDPSNGILDPAYAYTISAWVKFSSTSNYGFIVSKSSGGAGGYELFRNTGTGAIRFSSCDGSGVCTGGYFDITTTGTYNDNQWHHIGATAATNSTAKIYIDGILVKESGTITQNNINTTDPLTIGNRGNHGSGVEFSGSIDDVRIYNYARSSKQIVEDMNAGHPAGGSPVGSQVLYWKFDEGYGTTPKDSSPQANNATAFVGTPTWINDGKFGKALNFNGADAGGDYVSIPFNNSLDVFSKTNWTVSMWVRPQGGCPSTCVVLNARYHKPRISVSNTTALVEANVSSVFTSIVSTTGITANRWNHVVFWADGNTDKIYINGVEKASAAYKQIDPTWDQLHIGASGWASEDYQGDIDEVKIYNYSLTPDEIKLDYNRGASMVLGTMSDTSGLTGGSIASSSATASYCVPGSTDTCSPPVAEWNFDEKNGTNANDTSGNGNVGALIGSTLPAWISGKIGGALSFNGTAGYVNLTSLPTITAPYTVEFWFYPKSLGSIQTILSLKGANGLPVFNLHSNNKLLAYAGWEKYKYGTKVFAAGDLNKWWHVAFVVADSAVLTNWKVYLNGLDDTGNPGANTGTYYDPSAPGQIGYGQGYLNGYIDQVKVYGYTRTPSQIAWDYNRGAPIGWWKFDDCQGTTANDSSGNGNSGTITIGATIPQSSAGTCTDGLATSAWYNGRTGKYNSSLNFDGADDLVNIGTSLNSAVTNSRQVTWSAWIYPADKATTQIVGWGYTNGVWVDSAKALVAEINVDNVRQGATPRYSIPTWNTWYHVVGVGDAINGFTKLYVNGIQIGSVTFTPGSVTSLSGNLQIGAGYGYFNGQIDDVRIYNYALTAAQVKQLFNQGSAARFAPITGTP